MAAKVVIDVEAQFVDNVTQRVTQAEKAIARLEKQVQALGRSKASPTIAPQTTKAETALVKLEQRALALGRTKTALTLQAVDRASQVLNKVWNTGKNIVGKVWRVTVSVLDKATAPIRSILNLLKNPLLSLGITLGVGGGVADTVKTYASFESKMSEVKAISGASAIDMRKLNAKAAEMGATTKFTATESGDAMKYMAMAGWDSGDILSGVEGVINLAAAAGEDLGRTSDIVTDAMTAFGMKANEATHFADVLAVASSRSNTNVGMLGESFKYVAPLAGSLGYSIEDTATALGLMANAGIKSSMGGTALRGGLSNMLSPTKKATAIMDKYGVSLQNADGSSKTLLQIMKNLRSSFGGLDAAILTADGDINDGESILQLAKASGKSAEQMEKLQAVSELFGVRALPGMLAVIQASEEDFNSLSNAIENSEGAAKSMARIMLDNLQGSFTLCRDAVNGVERSIGERLSPYLRQFLDWLTSEMPDVQNAVNNALDSIESKIQRFKETFRELTKSTEWKNADLFGKAKLVWDALIAEPFSAWWSRVGGGVRKTLFAGIREIGSFMGQALMQGLQSAIRAHPFASLLGGAFLGSGALSNIIGFSARIAHTVTRVSDFGANTAIQLGAGNLKNGGSLGAKGLTAIGLGSVAGGLVGGAALLSGANDLVTSLNSKNKQDVNTYAYSGFAKIGGVAAGAFGGAKLGAAIGAVGGPAGALIGAGLGGIVGILAGDAIVRHMKAAKFETEEMKNAIKDTNVSTEELARTFDKAVYTNMQDHFGDMELSLSEIQRLSNQIVWGEGENGKLDDYTKFAEATQAVEASLQSLQAASSQVDRWMWKAGLGVTFDTGEIQSIQTAFDDYIQASKEYVENKHYEFTASVSLLIDAESTEGKSLIESGNSIYANLQSELDSLGQELSNTVKISLEGDGIISIKENDAIISLQKQISDIIKKVSNAEQAAQMDLSTLKFSGKKLSLNSYESLMSELKKNVDDGVSAYDQAYITAAAGAKLELDSANEANPENKTQNLEKYNQRMNQLNQGYTADIRQINDNAANKLLGIIGDNYQKELGVNAVEKMKNALSQSLSQGIEPIEWTTEDAEKFLGVQNLSAESAAALGQFLSGVNEFIEPQDVSVDGKVKPELELETDANLTEKVKNILSSQELTAEISGQINADWTVAEVGDPGAEILALVSPDGQYAVPFQVLADVGWTVSGDKFNPALLSPDGLQRVPISAEAAVQWENMVTMPEIPEISVATETVTVPVTGTAIVENTVGLDTNAFNLQIPAVTEPVETTVPVNVNAQCNNVKSFDPAVLSPSESFSAFTQVNITANYQSNPFLGRALEDFSIQSAYEFPTAVTIAPNYGVYPKFQGRSSDFGIRSVYTAQTTVSLQVHYATTKDPLPNLTGGIRQARGGVIGKNGLMGFAAGGMVRGGAQLVTVAEEGTPEMIIPLGAQRRERGLYLWEKAGRMLNVPRFAAGGIVGTSRTNTESIRQKISDAPQSSSTSAPITVTVGNITIQIEVNGENKDLLSSIENQKEEIANIIGGVIRETLENTFANTPALGGKTA